MRWRGTSEISAVVMVMLGVGGCGSSAPAPTTPRALAFATPLKVGVISFYNDHCARCHQPYGTGLTGDALQLPADQYQGHVSYMVTGLSAAELPETETAALAAYCRSTKLEKAFACVVAGGSFSGGLDGEMSPGATVSLRMGQSRLEARVDGHRFSFDRAQFETAKSQAGEAWTDAELIVVLQGVETRLRLAAAPFIGPPHPKEWN